MRYDIPVYFQKITPGGYNKETGDYEDDSVDEIMMLANVTDTETETLQLVYGDIRQDSLTVRLQGHYPGTFDKLRIGENIYRVDYQRDLRHKQTFVVSEVQ